MRYGLIADIHSNLEALEQVLPRLESVDEILCLGDIVGYGPSPSECIALLKQTHNITISGNHDLGCTDQVDLYSFNPYAQEACEWTKPRLTEDEKDYLLNLPSKMPVGESLLLTHGSPQNPTWEYLISLQDAEINFNKHIFQICFVGHTHVPVIFQEPASGKCELTIPEPEALLQLDRNTRYIINPGSVGQPRDGDPRSSFAIFDDENYTIEFFRLAYPVEETQKKMKKTDLPAFLADRLVFGL